MVKYIKAPAGEDKKVDFDQLAEKVSMFLSENAEYVTYKLPFSVTRSAYPYYDDWFQMVVRRDMLQNG